MSYQHHYWDDDFDDYPAYSRPPMPRPNRYRGGPYNRRRPPQHFHRAPYGHRPREPPPLNHPYPNYFYHGVPPPPPPPPFPSPLFSFDSSHRRLPFLPPPPANMGRDSPCNARQFYNDQKNENTSSKSAQSASNTTVVKPTEAKTITMTTDVYDYVDEVNEEKQLVKQDQQCVYVQGHGQHKQLSHLPDTRDHEDTTVSQDTDGPLHFETLKPAATAHLEDVSPLVKMNEASKSAGLLVLDEGDKGKASPVLDVDDNSNETNPYPLDCNNDEETKPSVSLDNNIDSLKAPVLLSTAKIHSHSDSIFDKAENSDPPEQSTKADANPNGARPDTYPEKTSTLNEKHLIKDCYVVLSRCDEKSWAGSVPHGLIREGNCQQKPKERSAQSRRRPSRARKCVAMMEEQNTAEPDPPPKKARARKSCSMSEQFLCQMSWALANKAVSVYVNTNDIPLDLMYKQQQRRRRHIAESDDDDSMEHSQSTASQQHGTEKGHFTRPKRRPGTWSDEFTGPSLTRKPFLTPEAEATSSKCTQGSEMVKSHKKSPSPAKRDPTPAKNNPEQGEAQETNLKSKESDKIEKLSDKMEQVQTYTENSAADTTAKAKKSHKNLVDKKNTNSLKSNKSDEEIHEKLNKGQQDCPSNKHPGNTDVQSKAKKESRNQQQKAKPVKCDTKIQPDMKSDTGKEETKYVNGKGGKLVKEGKIVIKLQKQKNKSVDGKAEWTNDSSGEKRDADKKEDRSEESVKLPEISADAALKVPSKQRRMAHKNITEKPAALNADQQKQQKITTVNLRSADQGKRSKIREPQRNKVDPSGLADDNMASIDEIVALVAAGHKTDATPSSTVVNEGDVPSAVGGDNNTELDAGRALMPVGAPAGSPSAATNQEVDGIVQNVDRSEDSGSPELGCFDPTEISPAPPAKQTSFQTGSASMANEEEEPSNLLFDVEASTTAMEGSIKEPGESVSTSTCALVSQPTSTATSGMAHPNRSDAETAETNNAVTSDDGSSTTDVTVANSQSTNGNDLQKDALMLKHLLIENEYKKKDMQNTIRPMGSRKSSDDEPEIIILEDESSKSAASWAVSDQLDKTIKHVQETLCGYEDITPVDSPIKESRKDDDFLLACDRPQSEPAYAINAMPLAKPSQKPALSTFMPAPPKRQKPKHIVRPLNQTPQSDEGMSLVMQPNWIPEMRESAIVVSKGTAGKQAPDSPDDHKSTGSVGSVTSSSAMEDLGKCVSSERESQSPPKLVVETDIVTDNYQPHNAKPTAVHAVLPKLRTNVDQGGPGQSSRIEVSIVGPPEVFGKTAREQQREQGTASGERLSRSPAPHMASAFSAPLPGTDERVIERCDTSSAPILVGVRPKSIITGVGSGGPSLCLPTSTVGQHQASPQQRTSPYRASESPQFKTPSRAGLAMSPPTHDTAICQQPPKKRFAFSPPASVQDQLHQPVNFPKDTPEIVDVENGNTDTASSNNNHSKVPLPGTSGVNQQPQNCGQNERGERAGSENILLLRKRKVETGTGGPVGRPSSTDTVAYEIPPYRPLHAQVTSSVSATRMATSQQAPTATVPAYHSSPPVPTISNGMQRVLASSVDAGTVTSNGTVDSSKSWVSAPSMVGYGKPVIAQTPLPIRPQRQASNNKLDGQDSPHNSTTMAQYKLIQEIKQLPHGEAFQNSLNNWEWITLDNVRLPAVFRSGDKFVAVHMVQMRLLSKFPPNVPGEIMRRHTMVSHKMNVMESWILNTVNALHCKYDFGCQLFTTQDEVVKLADVEKFYWAVKAFNLNRMAEIYRTEIRGTAQLHLVLTAHISSLKSRAEMDLRDVQQVVNALTAVAASRDRDRQRIEAAVAAQQMAVAEQQSQVAFLNTHYAQAARQSLQHRLSSPSTHPPVSQGQYRPPTAGMLNIDTQTAHQNQLLAAYQTARLQQSTQPAIYSPHHLISPTALPPSHQPKPNTLSITGHNPHHMYR